MNKLIKQLDQRAVDYAMSVCDANGVYKGKEYLTVVKEKFAELIVRECVEQLRYTVLDTQELRRDKSTDYQVGWEDGMFDAEVMIKDHFGVEE